MKVESILFLKSYKKLKGGPKTFFENFKKILKKNNCKYYFNEKNLKSEKIFIISCTIKNFFWLLKKKLTGAQVIQRVDGKLWQYKKKNIGLYNKIYSILFNLTIYITMVLISDKIIFQSRYVKKLWSNKFIKKKKKFTIYNFYTTEYKKKIKKKYKTKIVCVEGNFEDAFNAAEHVKLIKNYPIYIFGVVEKSTVDYFKNFKNIKFMGLRDKKQIFKFFKSNHKIIFYSLEFKSGCSNSVIEAMSHSIPIIGFNSGSMNELVSPKNGILINYDLNKFNNKRYLEKIQIEKKIKKIENNYEYFSKNSLLIARKKFNKEINSSKYIESIFKK
jgi:glycosyltransferase involved in cell wall biosynthesis